MFAYITFREANGGRAVTDVESGPTGLTAFRQRFPDRFFDVGIAEQHAMTSAACQAMGGLHPVVAIYSMSSTARSPRS